MLVSSPAALPALPAVMLIEAEPMLRLTMAKFLRSAGCQVVACPDVRSCADALAAETVHPALIVLGARVLDAETARGAQRLRELAPDAPVLGVVDVIDPVVRESRLPAGLRFLAPPFDLPDLLRAVRSYLRQAGFRLPELGLLEA
jgi:DNA-binding response OmpR family regulator